MRLCVTIILYVYRRPRGKQSLTRLFANRAYTAYDDVRAKHNDLLEMTQERTTTAIIIITAIA